MRPLKVEYCGEWYTVESGEPFTIGRESDLTIDDNPYLHRTFLTLSSEYGLWWLANVGQLLSATVSDATGSVQAWVAPGAKLPLVFQTVHVMFSAGATTSCRWLVVRATGSIVVLPAEVVAVSDVL